MDDPIALQKLSGFGQPCQPLAFDEDLVVYDSDFPSQVYDNRWMFSNEVARCRSVLASAINPNGTLPMKKTLLRRLKIYGARNELSTAILNYLNNNVSLIQLEIDTLRLPARCRQDVNIFYNLRALSIGAIQFEGEWNYMYSPTTIKFHAPQLTHVYLGSSSIDQVRFVDYRSITSLTYGTSRCANEKPLLNYAGLQRLTCEEYGPMDWNIMSFVSSVNFVSMGSFLTRGPHVGQLVYLDVSVSRATSTSSLPDEVRMRSLNILHLHLFIAYASGWMRPQLMYNCHFFGVRLNFSAPNDLQYQSHLTSKLVQYHHRFTSNWHWPVSTYPSVIQAEYLDVEQCYGDYSAVADLGQPPVPEVEHLGFWKFAQMYPNIQIVNLDERQSQGLIRPNVFLSFLRACRALTQLFIRTIDTFNADFYNQLATIEALAELKCLQLVKRKGASVEGEIDFNLLIDSFTQLTYLHTNLARRDVWLDLLARRPMRMLMFDFAFWYQPPKEKPNQAWYRFLFNPTSALRHEYNLNIYQMTLTGESHPLLIESETLSASNRTELFDNLPFNHLTRHWLD